MSSHLRLVTDTPTSVAPAGGPPAPPPQPTHADILARVRRVERFGWALAAGIVATADRDSLAGWVLDLAGAWLGVDLSTLLGGLLP